MKKLIIWTSFGGESEVYLKAKFLWNYYSSYFKNLPETFFYCARYDESILEGELRRVDDDFIVGVPEYLKAGRNAYSDTNPVWSNSENEKFIYRDIKFFQHVDDVYKDNYWVYYHTITSVVDYIALRNLVNSIECNSCYAGFPLAMLNSQEHSGRAIPKVGLKPYFWGVSGAGVLLSSDIVKFLLSEKDTIDKGVPIDVWMSLILRDIPKLALPRFDIGMPEFNCTEEQIRALMLGVPALGNSGFHHFRVNSLMALNDRAKRLFTDPPIISFLANIMKAGICDPAKILERGILQNPGISSLLGIKNVGDKFSA